MKENQSQIKYSINWDSFTITKEEIKSEKFIKHLKEEELATLLTNPNTQLGIVSERDLVEWIDKNDNQSLWKNRIQSHVCETIYKDDDDFMIGCEYSDFKGGYFYVASLWEMTDSLNLIILEHYH